MGHRRIEGSKHIRRKLTTKAKIAIGVAVLAVMSLGGFFFINNTDRGSELKEKISEMSIVSESYEAFEAYGEGSKPSSEVGSIIKITASSLWIPPDDDETKMEKGGGIVSGGGTLRQGETLTLTATAHDGYTFRDWLYYDAKVNKYVSLLKDNSTITIANGDVAGAGKTCKENTEIIARFKKKAPTFNYTYNFSISPAVGRLGDIKYYKKDDPTIYTLSSPNRPSVTIKSSNYMSSIDVVKWNLNYSELSHNFSSEIKTHTTTSSDGKSNDSLTVSKMFTVGYDIYVYKESGELYDVQRDQSVYITVDIATGSDYDTAVANVEKIIELHPKSPNDGSNVWNYVIVPHTMSGGSYQAITVADPKEGGSTNGDRVSALPFSTTLSAEAAPGYKFDRWTWKELIAENGFDVSYKEMESKEKSPTVAPNGTVIYTAHFIPETYNVDAENITPEEGGTILGLGDYKAHADVPITISPSPGYKLENWTYKTSDGDTYSGSSENFTIKDITSDVKISVKFTSTKARIDVKASPVDGGSVTVENKKTNSDGKKKDYEEFVIGEEDAELVATPADTNGDGTPDYTFLYWMDSQNKKYEESTLTLKKVASSEKFTAYFAPAKIKITTDVYPKTDASGSAVDAGSVKITGDAVTQTGANPDVYEATPNTSVTIKATEGSGYHFQKFIDNNGNEYPSNPLIKSDLTADTTFTAVFVEDDFTIKVVASPVTGGKVTINGIEGELKVAYGQHIKLEAKPNEGYKFLYYKDSIGNEYISNPLEFDAINGSETYTAYFVKDEVNITIDLTPEGSGTVKFNSETPVSSQKTYPASGLSNVTLTATPKNDYKFLYWKDQDGNVYPDNPLVVVNITKDLKFIAIFDGEYDTIRAIASPPSGGKITKIINDDGSITLIAKANRGYKFKYWKKPDGKTTSSKFTIPASQVKAGDVYTAYFKINPDYDARSDITKEQFYREWRKVITPNYTVTRDYMKLLAMESVAGLRQYNDATPSLKSYGAFADAQAYFDSKTGETVKRLDLLFGDSEMISAENEILTPDSLPDADNYLKIAQNFTDKKFGKKYDTEILTVKRVLEPSDFNNKKRTYLWRYTGAEYKDNIYLLYGIDDKKPKYVTPIVDEDGVLKFTIDKLEDNDVVAVVRVKIIN